MVWGNMKRLKPWVVASLILGSASALAYSGAIFGVQWMWGGHTREYTTATLVIVSLSLNALWLATFVAGLIRLRRRALWLLIGGLFAFGPWIGYGSLLAYKMHECSAKGLAPICSP